jgi:hypothetical protein
MRRPPNRARPPRGVNKKPTDHWSHADEDLLQAGIWRYSESHNALAERRRMSDDEFWATIPQRFGGTQPPDKREERDNE